MIFKILPLNIAHAFTLDVLLFAAQFLMGQEILIIKRFRLALALKSQLFKKFREHNVWFLTFEFLLARLVLAIIELGTAQFAKEK